MLIPLCCLGEHEWIGGVGTAGESRCLRWSFNGDVTCTLELSRAIVVGDSKEPSPKEKK
jgi:hypothetical protein